MDDNPELGTEIILCMDCYLLKLNAWHNPSKIAGAEHQITNKLNEENKMSKLKKSPSVGVNAIVVLALLLIYGCGDGGVKLEQSVKLRSVINCRYVVNTEIWVVNWSGTYNILEYDEYAYCNYAQIDSVKRVEKEKAEKLLPKIIECSKRGCP